MAVTVADTVRRVRVSAFAVLDINLVDVDDARELADAIKEAGEIVVATHQLELDRRLGIELVGHRVAKGELAQMARFDCAAMVPTPRSRFRGLEFLGKDVREDLESFEPASASLRAAPAG